MVNHALGFSDATLQGNTLPNKKKTRSYINLSWSIAGMKIFFFFAIRVQSC